MWFLVIVFVGLAANFAIGDGDYNANQVFQKCCSGDQSLVKIVDFASDERYECVSSEDTNKSYNISLSPLLIGRNVEVQYNSILNCDEVRGTKTSGELTLMNNRCYDRLVVESANGTLKSNGSHVMELDCASLNQTEESLNLKLTNIRKCCPSGQSYDTQYHLCRVVEEEENDESWLMKRLDTGNAVYIVDYDLHCKANEYAVELKEDLFKIDLQGTSLRVESVEDAFSASSFGPTEWCADRAFGGGLVARGCTRNCSTFGAYCLRKCCPVGQHYKLRRCGSTASNCVPNDGYDFLFNLTYYLDPFVRNENIDLDVMGIKSSLQCPSGKFMLERNKSADKHHLGSSGDMVVPIILGGPTTQDYCMETFDRRACDAGITVDTLMCFTEYKEQKDFRSSFVVISISCVFLALTLVVYIPLPELRNMHGRNLICHVSMMLLAFCCLARVQYDRVDDRRVCKLLGYGIYFGFVAAFSWLNVMCLDIWWTFGSVRSAHPLRKDAQERRRFAWYSLYAWGVAVLMTVTMLLLDVYPITKVLDSNIGQDICWFGSLQNTMTDWPHYIFFVFPMGVVTCVNFVLWILTVRHCNRIKSEVHRLQAGSVGDRAKRRFRADKARFILTGKLWVVMGAGWVWELLSTVVTRPLWFWSVLDKINELQGVFIFLILVFKPKLYYLIRKKLGLEKPELKNGATSTGRTSSTFLSRTISSDERTQLRVSVPPVIKPEQK